MKVSSVKVDIAPAELIDKITILSIKSERIDDVEKRKNVQSELDILTATRDQVIQPSASLNDLTLKLKDVNERLWVIEDDIRSCEATQEFGSQFIELARAVYRQNDERARLKREINNLLGSKIIEEKSQYLIKKNRPGDMLQALMDFGSLICKPRNPLCNICVISNSCLAFKKNIVYKIPNKKKISFKQKPIKFALAYVITSKKNNILLHKRPSVGMLPSMMGIPTSPWLNRSFNKDDILKFNPLKLNYDKVSGTMIYSFSHFNLKIKIFYSNINEKKIKNYRWYSLKSLNNIELPTIMKNIIYYVIK